MEKYLKDEPRLRPNNSCRNYIKQLSPCVNTSQIISKAVHNPISVSATYQTSHNSVPNRKEIPETDGLLSTEQMDSWDIFNSVMTKNDNNRLIQKIDNILDDLQNHTPCQEQDPVDITDVCMDPSSSSSDGDQDDTDSDDRLSLDDLNIWETARRVKSNLNFSPSYQLPNSNLTIGLPNSGYINNMLTKEYRPCHLNNMNNDNKELCSEVSSSSDNKASIIFKDIRKLENNTGSECQIVGTDEPNFRFLGQSNPLAHFPIKNLANVAEKRNLRSVIEATSPNSFSHVCSGNVMVTPGQFSTSRTPDTSKHCSSQCSGLALVSNNIIPTTTSLSCVIGTPLSNVIPQHAHTSAKASNDRMKEIATTTTISLPIQEKTDVDVINAPISLPSSPNILSQSSQIATNCLTLTTCNVEVSNSNVTTCSSIPTRLIPLNPVPLSSLRISSSNLVNSPSKYPKACSMKSICSKNEISFERDVVENSECTNTNMSKSSKRLRTTDQSPEEENKKRTHRCNFTNCHKVYTKSSHLKAHQRTHTGKSSCLGAHRTIFT